MSITDASAAITLRAPYRPRPIRFLELVEPDGWRVKVYGISVLAEHPAPALVEHAKQMARERLPSPAVAPGRYGVAFLTVHEGRDADFILVDWWNDENLLQHHVYRGERDGRLAFDYFSPTGNAVCVWELRVLAFERQAWLDAVLANPAGPNLDAYLAHRLNEDA